MLPHHRPKSNVANRPWTETSGTMNLKKKFLHYKLIDLSYLLQYHIPLLCQVHCSRSYIITLVLSQEGECVGP